ncbi:hypothetical protein CPC08DRAFT_161522 [Agrocybe pediades]|nr:hypothetical protein CPC08DRAFT_161522 [Agrocybe pediades]
MAFVSSTIKGEILQISCRISLAHLHHMLNESCEATASLNLANRWDKSWAHSFQSNNDHFFFPVSTSTRRRRRQVRRKIHEDGPGKDTGSAQHDLWHRRRRGPYVDSRSFANWMADKARFTSHILPFRSCSMHCGRGSHRFFSANTDRLKVLMTSDNPFLEVIHALKHAGIRHRLFHMKM